MQMPRPFFSQHCAPELGSVRCSSSASASTPATGLAGAEPPPRAVLSQAFPLLVGRRGRRRRAGGENGRGPKACVIEFLCSTGPVPDQPTSVPQRLRPRPSGSPKSQAWLYGIPADPANKRRANHACPAGVHPLATFVTVQCRFSPSHPQQTRQSPQTRMRTSLRPTTPVRLPMSSNAYPHAAHGRRLDVRKTQALAAVSFAATEPAGPVWLNCAEPCRREAYAGAPSLTGNPCCVP